MDTKFFPSMDYVPKIITKRDMRCCEFPYVTAGDPKNIHRASNTIPDH